MNTFMHPVGELHFGTYKPEDLKPALDQLEEQALIGIEKLLKVPSDQRTFQTLEDIGECIEPYEQAVSLVYHLDSVLSGPWQEPVAYASEKYARFASELGLRKDIYQVHLDVKANQYDDLSKSQKRSIDEAIKQYKLGGIDLPDDKKKELKELQAQIAALSNQFGKNVVDANDTAGLHLKDKEELTGLDDEFIEACKKAAEDKDLAGFWVQYSPPNVDKIMSFADVRATRDAMHKVNVSRISTDNIKIASDMLSARSRVAEILGFDTYADLTNSTRMPGSAQNIDKFLEKLKKVYVDAARNDYLELQEFARSYEDDPDLELALYEHNTGLDWYYARKHKAELYKADEKVLTEYLEFSHVLQVMFKTLGTMYGVTFKPNMSIASWHDDVEVYDLHSEDGDHIATVWCDWLARQGKNGGAWMNSHYVAERSNGDFSSPHLGYVCCNFDSPTKTRPTLLTIRDVETLWHEFGHFMHLALNTTELRSQSMNSVDRDFIEAPSQIMENFVWVDDVMMQMAKHYKTGKKLPVDMWSKLKEARNYRVAAKAVRQLSYAMFDMYLHSGYNPETDGDITEVGRSFKNKLCPVETEEFDNWPLSFTHIFDGGYSAGYYGYKWAETIEADLFSRFLDEGPLNPEVGRAYRDTLLSRGDEAEPKELIHDFLGRDFTQDAMLKRDGILAEKK